MDDKARREVNKLGGFLVGFPGLPVSSVLLFIAGSSIYEHLDTIFDPRVAEAGPMLAWAWFIGAPIAALVFGFRRVRKSTNAFASGLITGTAVAIVIEAAGTLLIFFGSGPGIR